MQFFIIYVEGHLPYLVLEKDDRDRDATHLFDTKEEAAAYAEKYLSGWRYKIIETF